MGASIGYSFGDKQWKFRGVQLGVEIERVFANELFHGDSATNRLSRSVDCVAIDFLF